MMFCKNDELLVLFELMIQKNTVVKYLGYHTNLTENFKPAQKVTFEDIGKSEGLIGKYFTYQIFNRKLCIDN